MRFLDFNVTHFLDALAAEYRGRGVAVDYKPFCYVADFLPLASNSTETRQVAIDKDGDFCITAHEFTCFDGAGASVAQPNVLVRLFPETSQRVLQSAPVHLLNIFGTGQQPHVLYRPLILPAKSSLRVELQNLQIVALTIRLVFEGVKVYSRRS